MAVIQAVVSSIEIKIEPDSEYLVEADEFNWNAQIPSDATIEGIQIDANACLAAGTNPSTELTLLEITNGDDDYSDRKKPSTEGYTTYPTFSLETYGGLETLWGLSWTPTDFNTQRFAVRFRGEGVLDEGIFYSNSLRVYVQYTDPAPGRINIIDNIKLTSGKISL